MVLPKKADNSCWLDAMVVAMRMQGVGRLAYDASDVSVGPTGSLLELLRADWFPFTSRDIVDEYKGPLLHHISARSGGQIRSGDMANPGELWDYCAVYSMFLIQHNWTENVRPMR